MRSFLRSAVLVLGLPALAACGASRPPAVVTTTAAKVEVPARAVQGKVLAPDGRPVAGAQARLIGPANAVEAEAIADATGSFSLPIAPGAARVRRVVVSGPGLQSHRVVVALAEAPVTITIQLGSYPAPTDANGTLSVALAPRPGTWTSLPLGAPSGGAYALAVELRDGEYPYRLHSGASVIGDGYVTVTAGKAKIALDLARRPAPGAAPVVTFGEASKVSAAVDDVFGRLESARAALRGAIEAGLRSGRPAREVAAAFAWSDLRGGLARLARASGDPLVQRAAAVAYFAEGTFASPAAEESAIAHAIVAAVPPDDALWSIAGSPVTGPGAFANVTALAALAPDADYVRAFVEKHPDAELAAAYLLERLRAAKDPERARATVQALKDRRFAGTIAAARAPQLDPDRATAPGKPVPAFAVPALGKERLEPRKRYTPRSFGKRVFLIDLWATGSDRCVAALPTLADLHATYGSAKRGKRRLEVLSVAIDAEPAKVVAFRKEPGHAMPWRNAVADPAQAKALFEALGVESSQVPFYLLADEDGKIIATSPDLDDSTLRPMIERTMKLRGMKPRRK